MKWVLVGPAIAVAISMNGANHRIGMKAQIIQFDGYRMAIVRFFIPKILAADQSIERGLNSDRYLLSMTGSSFLI